MIKKLRTPQKFALEIEDIVQEKNIDYLDAIMHYCEVNNIEPDAIASLVRNNQTLKAKLYTDCMQLNLVEKTAILPF